MRSITRQPILTRAMATRPMRFTLAVVLLLGVASAISVAQDGRIHKRQAGKGTKADLSRYKDKSDLVLHQNTRTGPASELNKIEQQSMHPSPSAGSRPRVKSAALPKTSAAKVDRNMAINFSGHSAGGKQSFTNTNKKSAGKSATSKAPMGMGGRVH